METLKMHFTIGKNLGIRLHEISLDHLHQYNVKKALETWTKSLCCGNDIAVKLMKMELICDIDTDKQKAIVTPKHEFNQERLAAYPTFDTTQFCERVEKYVENLANYGSRIIANAQKLANLDYYINAEKEDIDKWMDLDPETRNAPFVLKKDNCEDFLNKAKKFNNHKENIVALFDILNYNPDTFWGNADAIEDYYTLIKAKIKEETKETPTEPKKEPSENEFKPTDICAKQFAVGWLAPNGDYFGMDGIKAQMCHIQLSKKICDYYGYTVDYGCEYSYLEDNGFVKIDGNWILYAGYDRCLNKPEIPITDKQIDALKAYGEQFFGQKLFFGYDKKFCSTARLAMLDKFALKKLLILGI